MPQGSYAFYLDSRRVWRVSEMPNLRMVWMPRMRCRGKPRCRSHDRCRACEKVAMPNTLDAVGSTTMPPCSRRCRDRETSMPVDTDAHTVDAAFLVEEAMPRMRCPLPWLRYGCPRHLPSSEVIGCRDPSHLAVAMPLPGSRLGLSVERFQTSGFSAERQVK